MSKYCPMCGQVTNCTDNCKQCLEEENENAWNEAVDFAILPQIKEIHKCPQPKTSLAERNKHK